MSNKLDAKTKKIIKGSGSDEDYADKMTKVQQKRQRIREYRKEASRLAAIANKRIDRLIRNDLTNTPAYLQYIEGKQRFSVKGKDFNEVQAEMSRLRGFLAAKTSTIRGANQVMKDIASNTGIKYKTMKDLKTKSTKFFELASKIEQYLRNVHDAASAISYQKIWESINVEVQEQRIDLEDGEANLDAMIKRVSDALVEYDEEVPVSDGWGWYSVKKDDI